MRAGRFLATMLVGLITAAPALAQQQMQPRGQAQQPQGDQVDQLDRLLDLDDDQEQELRSLLETMESEIEEQRQQAQQLQQQMGEHVSPDYDEDAIRADARKLGDLTADITANSVLLQSRMEAIFTEEQRQTLEQKMREQQRQMQQMRQQMQQQQGGGRPAPRQ